jgi:transposase
MRQESKRKAPRELPVVKEDAAGIDVGARDMYVAVPPDRDAESVRIFPTFTRDLHRIADWLESCQVRTVAMESTGVYWIPLYQILEKRGLEVCLVNARYMRNVPGRRTDWYECQWLQYLHSVGLLRAAFRPPEQICAVRSVMRHREGLVEMASHHIQHVHKALTQMNLQIHHVISDITGVTGKAIIEAIIEGERNPEKLAAHREPEIKADPETIRKSLEGDWREEHLFTLRQSWKMHKYYVKAIEECDRQIVKLLGEVDATVDPDQRPLPPDNKRRTQRKNKRTGDFRFDVRTEAYKHFGVDVTRIPGVAGIAISLFSELGADLHKWPSGGRFASWAALCPDNDKTGGQVVYTAVRAINNRVGQLFRQAANSLHHSGTAMGEYLRRMKAKLGARAGITATAHRIARIFYAMVTQAVEYDETLWQKQDAERQRRSEARLKRQAHKLGYQLLPLPAGN